ncbi:hypothetical protein PROFUN_02057 [Planoprotostelium fungivorum]|uniref:Uncharacterized protein n=1 Tax=Planoprotostelium fungivorum TaxID=1890364 RepID=A0A2P6NBA7_9EUKA|nr:hypothetical protein PROFUN_02057 [Planoprotostelium fungivorum]
MDDDLEGIVEGLLRMESLFNPCAGASGVQKEPPDPSPPHLVRSLEENARPFSLSCVSPTDFHIMTQSSTAASVQHDDGKKKKKRYAALLDSMKHFVAGGAAGAVSRTTVSPLERLKILYQVQPRGQEEYKTIRGSLTKMYRDEGWRGYFKGNGTNIVRIVPYSAAQFAAFEQFKKMLTKPGEKDLTPLNRLNAGAMAGIVSVVVTYPLDLIRTRLSVQSTTAPKYNGIAHAWKMIIKQEGVHALFKGITPTVMGVAPYVGLNFMTYETLKAFVKTNMNPEPTTTQLLTCGGMAGAIAQTITYPCDVLRRKMQMQGFNESHPVYGSTWNAVRTVWAQETWRGFYKGLIPNYLKVVPAISISFVTYEYCKKFLNATDTNNNSSIMSQVLLFGYPESPYFQKLKHFLSFLSVPYAIVPQPRMLPRPDFQSVGITYRRIPLLAVDGEVYMDTVAAIDRLCEMKGVPNAKEFESFARELFPICAGLLPAAALSDEAFLKDRSELTGYKWSPQTFTAGRPKAFSKFLVVLDIIENQFLSKNRFLKGEECSTADLHVFHLTSWVIRTLRNTLATPEVTPETHPKLHRWMDDVAKKLSNNKPKQIQFQDIRSSLLSPNSTKTPAHHDAEPLQLKRGEEITVTPTDSGRNHPQKGKLVAINPVEVCLVTKEGARLHFSRHNYDVKRAPEAKSSTPASKL